MRNSLFVFIILTCNFIGIFFHLHILPGNIRGLFAGVSIEGAVLNQDDKANRKLYGRKIKATDILLNGSVSTPAAGQQLVQLLRKYSPKNISDVSKLRRSDAASSGAR